MMTKNVQNLIWNVWSLMAITIRIQQWPHQHQQWPHHQVQKAHHKHQRK